MITKNVTQTEWKDLYVAGTCRDTNGKRDWKVGTRKNCSLPTCGDKDRCSKPDLDLCKLTPSSDAVSSSGWAGKDGGSQKTSTIECVYNPRNINSIEEIEAWKTRFGGTGPEWDQIMTGYCSKAKSPNVSCIVDPNTNQPITPSCSRMMSTGPEGELCRNWFYQQPANVRDAVIANYCADNPNNPDCICYRRSADPLYRAMTQNGALPFNDGCWYAPCKNSAATLIPSDVHSLNCPTINCSSIMTNIGSSIEGSTVDSGRISCVNTNTTTSISYPNTPPATNPVLDPSTPNPTEAAATNPTTPNSDTNNQESNPAGGNNTGDKPFVTIGKVQLTALQAGLVGVIGLGVVGLIIAAVASSDD